jgi:hypothetical protein
MTPFHFANIADSGKIAPCGEKIREDRGRHRPMMFVIHDI